MDTVLREAVSRQCRGLAGRCLVDVDGGRDPGGRCGAEGAGGGRRGNRGRPSVVPVGIKVTLVEPGGFGTDRSDPSAAHATPSAAATVPPEVVGAEQPPLRVLFGAAPTRLVKQVCAERLRTWADRERVSVATDGG
ncbi:hypothetical protein ACFVUN_29790 [Kitasatospora griseola]|uniref:hypothetical protein n=1 Tax=Kitasatospora griseola TaxID=2064 RepID=UPI0036D903C7